MHLSAVASLLPARLLTTGWEKSQEESWEKSWDSSQENSLDCSWEKSWEKSQEESWVSSRLCEQHERSDCMTCVSLADGCRQLSIDPKTLRRWLATAPFSLQPHPSDAPRKGLTEEQLRWLATAHHRSLPHLPQEPSQPAPVPEAEALALPDDLCEVLVALRALPTQLAALQEQVADLTSQLCHLSEPAPTVRSRAGATAKPTKSRGGSRGRTTSRQAQRPSKAQVLAVVEHAGEGRYVVISPKGGLLPFEPDSPAWFAWLTTCSSFRFVGKMGRLTAHRELHMVSRAVWRAHRNIRNRTYNLHLGKTEQLSIAVLEQAAAALHAHL